MKAYNSILFIALFMLTPQVFAQTTFNSDWIEIFETKIIELGECYAQPYRDALRTAEPECIKIAKDYAEAELVTGVRVSVTTSESKECRYLNLWSNWSSGFTAICELKLLKQ